MHLLKIYVHILIICFINRWKLESSNALGNSVLLLLLLITYVDTKWTCCCFRFSRNDWGKRELDAKAVPQFLPKSGDWHSKLWVFWSYFHKYWKMLIKNTRPCLSLNSSSWAWFPNCFSRIFQILFQMCCQIPNNTTNISSHVIARPDNFADGKTSHTTIKANMFKRPNLQMHIYF